MVIGTAVADLDILIDFLHLRPHWLLTASGTAQLLLCARTAPTGRERVVELLQRHFVGLPRSEVGIATAEAGQLIHAHLETGAPARSMPGRDAAEDSCVVVVCHHDILQQPGERRFYFYHVIPVHFLLL
jgi:hypothetical protein